MNSMAALRCSMGSFGDFGILSPIVPHLLEVRGSSPPSRRSYAGTFDLMPTDRQLLRSSDATISNGSFMYDSGCRLQFSFLVLRPQLSGRSAMLSSQDRDYVLC
jgi:hypothetical protein